MDRTGEAAELEAIRTLKARYFRLMDTKDWAGWRALFTDDLVAGIDYAVSTGGADGQTAESSGADAFAAMTEAAVGPCTTVHHGHMPEIALTSADSATGIWAMEDVVEWPDGRQLRGFGHYHESYRKDDDGWKIARLRLTRLRIDLTGDWSGPAAA